MNKISPRFIFYISIGYLFVYELVLLKCNELFPGAASFGRIANLLAAGYIPGYIVYYFVTEVPRKRDLSIAQEQIKNVKNYIVQDLSTIIVELELATDEELQKKVNNPSYKVESFSPMKLNYAKCEGVLKVPVITKKFVQESSREIFPQKKTFTAEIITKLDSEGTTVDIELLSWLQLITLQVKSTREHIDVLFTYKDYFTIEELGELLDTRNSSFVSYILNFEKSFENMQAAHRETWGGDFSEFFWEYYNLIRVMNGQEELKE
ncbi:hypothetical protein J2S74_001304 [Evansella vedderi]|uniref:Uncharacterized protein n=1 Tax=Evansella vedderi TaxID=38282 RepID=A0ABT9ZT88_9BACI|nr:hypothetical protein [Evansella vedderi]MDQ0253931.1 hypothetical protein [Evansella vedderi]